LKGDSPSADFCLATDKIMPENPYIHPMWTGSDSGIQQFFHQHPAAALPDYQMAVPLAHLLNFIISEKYELIKFMRKSIT
jgi:hypothetical protein